MSAENKTPAALAGATGGKEKTITQARQIATPAPARKDSVGSGDNGVPTPPEPLPWPSSFRLGSDGIYHVQDKGNGEVIDSWVFSPLVIMARTCDAHGKNWGLLLNVQAPNGQWHQWAMPAALLGGTSSQYRETLISLGLRVFPGNYKHLHTYLATANPVKTILCIDSIGWHGNSFVLPDITYAPERTDCEPELTLQRNHIENPFLRRGTIQEWQDHIGRYCIGNSRLSFGVSTPFAATLLKPCGHQNFGFHFTGNSSTGKTTLLSVAGSVCGGGGQNGYLHRWRVTDNALESIAVAHNDCLLCLDEIGQLPPNILAQSAYMLSNGQGKGRANKDGTGRPAPEWRLIFLSSGELSLEQKLQEEGRRLMAGQAVRVVSIPADSGLGHGVYETLHGQSDGKELSDMLQDAVSRYYGTPLRRFVECLTAQLDESRKMGRACIEKFEHEICPPGAEGQVQRVCRSFALVAAGGELATWFGVLPWPKGTAFHGAARCFRDWIACRGGLGASEAREALRRVRAFITANRTSRFEPWERGGPEVFHNSAGFRRETNGKVEFMIYRDTFHKEMCLGGDPKAVARYLLEAGYLEPDTTGNLLKPHFPPRLGKTVRFYTIKGDILGHEE